MKKYILFISLFLAMACAAPAPLYASGVRAADAALIDAALTDTAKVVYDSVKNPQIGMVGGDWAVFGLARSGYDIPRSYYVSYYDNAVKQVAANKGVLDERKYTEYSRVVIAMTAAGYDPRDVGGYDLTAPLGDFEKTFWQGVNGPIFALLALDCAGYDVAPRAGAPATATRDAYVAELLKRQMPDGGFALSAAAGASDPDITAMALQALAKYKDRADVKAASDKALKCLSTMRGGFTVWGDEGSESVVQTIVALCELGLGVNDSRFVDNGVSIMDILMKYYVAGKGFERQIGGGVNQMATEQALYALAAARRFDKGLPSLYDMSDTGVNRQANARSDNKLSERHGDVKTVPVVSDGKTFSDITGYKYKSSVEALAARGIINGKNASQFEPDASITRAEFATIVTRGLGLKENAANIFNDVTQSDWFYGYVGAAYKYGIVNGIAPDTFDPDGAINREEAAAMTARAAKLCGLNAELDEGAVNGALAGFGDSAAISGWGREPLAFLCEAGILPLAAANGIKPQEAVTRGEIAEMLYRLLDRAELL